MCSRLRRQLAIKLLENRERFLSLSIVRNKSLAVEAILDARQLSMRRAKIFQDPWARAAQERDLAERSDLVFVDVLDRKSTRLNSSHGYISYAVFCLKKKN